MSEVMSINSPMKPLGTTHKERQGDWLVTFEVVGWNEKCQCNTWAEKKRQFSPRPSYEWVLRSIEAEERPEHATAINSAVVVIGTAIIEACSKFLPAE